MNPAADCVPVASRGPVPVRGGVEEDCHDRCDSNERIGGFCKQGAGLPPNLRHEAILLRSQHNLVAVNPALLGTAMMGNRFVQVAAV